ncbi:cornulin [Meriones unguiculatus]|uniref:cornulin n=1 Tax=Meriones unguiculatus TaxID=10047 RepID=UPI000B4EDADC|nr:cornulin-like [Meriones unguiculatus]XP_021483778.1 cornulin [Meriones unguiculatus]
MPQLLQNIHGIIEAFRCYARSEGGCKVLTRGELKTLLEHEFADVIVKPHDPATVDEVLCLLDEDNTGTVEFKEFLVLVFKVARACFETLNERPRGVCMSDKSETCCPVSSKELEQGQRGATGVSKDGTEQCCEDRYGQRDQASRGQVRVGTHTHGQDSYPTQVSSHDRQAESQSQQIQMTGQLEQTQGIEDKSCTKERRSEQQSQISQQTDDITAGTTTQTQAGTFPTQESTSDQNRGSNSQDRSQADQASTQHYQTQAGFHPQIHAQMVEQGWRQQTGNGIIQTQRSIYDQNRKTETHGQDRNQERQATKVHWQTQEESYTQTHAQTVEQGRSQQAENSSIEMPGSICGQNRETEIHQQDSSQAGQVGIGHYQTQAGSYTQTLEHYGSQSTSQVWDQEKGQTQIQSCEGQSWTPVSNYDTGEPVLGGQVQSETNTVKERQEWRSNHPSLTGGQEERVPTVVREEWVNDHTRELVIQSQDLGSLNSGAPSAEGQDTAQMKEKK